MTNEAQRRANARYKKRNVKVVAVSFYPKDKQAYEFVKAHGGSTYLRELAYKAMDREGGEK